MGKGGGGNSAGQAQEEIARKLFGESTGLRQGIIGELEGILGFPATDFTPPAPPVESSSGGGGFLKKLIGRHPLGGPVLKSPIVEKFLGGPEGSMGGPSPAIRRPTGILEGAFRPAREALESQYGVAREQILGAVPARGGQLNQLLSDVAMERAGAVGGLKGQLINQAFGQALGLSTGMPALALSGLGGAGGLQAGAAERAARQQGALGSGIGALLGGGLGFALGGPPGAKAGATVGGGAGGAAGAK